jgi:hypothetical protein
MIAGAGTDTAPGVWSGMNMHITGVEADLPETISTGIRNHRGGTRSTTTMAGGRSGGGRGHWMQGMAETKSDAE